MTFPRKTFDIYDVECGIVKARNRLLTRIEPKGDLSAKKVFVIGHARTGTTSFYNLFNSAGMRAKHSAGNWHLAQADAFSDSGDFRPLDLYRRYYPNAYFVLNTRPLGPWLRSLLWQKGRTFTEKQVVNIIHRRNLYFASVINDFRGDPRLAVVDITRPGALAFAAEHAGIPYDVDVPRANAAPKNAEVKSLSTLDAVQRGPMGAVFDRPFIIPELLKPHQQPYSGWLDDVPNNLA